MTIMSRAGRGVVVSLWPNQLGVGMLSCLLAVGVLFVVGVSTASAEPKQIIGAFGLSGQDGPAGIAVNQTSGDVYVADVDSNSIQHFDADGNFQSNIGGPCSDPCAEGEFSFGGWLAGVAVAPDGSVYVADTSNNRVQKFTADGTFLYTFGVDVDTAGGTGFEVCTTACKSGVADSADGGLSSPIAVAVDPTTNDVLVADRDNQRIQRFDSTGNFVSVVATGLSNLHRIAVDSVGAIYVLDYRNRVLKIASDGSTQTDFAPALITTAEPPTDLAISRGVVPADDRVVVVQAHLVVQFEGSEVLELDTAGGLVETHLLPDLRADAASGLAANQATGRIYVSENDFNVDRVLILGTPLQTATIRDTTDVAATTATLNGTVNPGGGPSVDYRFEVSADTGATWTPFPVPDDSVPDGNTDVEVSQPATGLQPGTAYVVRLVVTNEFGATVVSATDDFETPVAAPYVTTLQASQLRPTAALLVGEVNPNSLPTTYHFEYGTTTAYGTSVPVPEASAGAGGAFVAVTHPINDLAPNTTYHYRLVATNDVGTTPGNDRTFTTRPAVADDPDPVGPRAYELVSPANKVGGTGVGHWYGGPDAVGQAGFAAWDGERFAVHGVNGSVLIDGKMTFIDDWSFAERTPGGWINKPGLSKRTFGVEAIADAKLTTAASDFSLTAFVGAHAMRLFPEMENWPDLGVPMLRKWTEDGWETFGPFDPFDPAQGAKLGASTKAIADDGSAVAISSSTTRGLAGLGDPSLDIPDLGNPADRVDDPSIVYLDEINGPFTDTFPGDDRDRELVNVCTEGTLILAPGGSAPCPPKPDNRDASLISPGGASLTSGNGGDAPQTIVSADGSRVFFMSPDPKLTGFGPAQLFIRQRNTKGKVVTRWISQSEVAGQTDSLRAPVLFEGASRDGDKVFFRTTSPLTADDPNGGCSGDPPPCMTGLPSNRSSDLYMYDLPDGPDGDPATPDDDPAGGDITRISAGPKSTGDCNSPVPEVSGQDTDDPALRFASHDASRAYFMCAAPLADVAASNDGTITSPGGDQATLDASNLYLYDSNAPIEQRWRFIARLPSGSGGVDACATVLSSRGSALAAVPGGAGNDVGFSPVNSCVRGTSDGTLVTFFTPGRLTADDPDQDSLDIYGYDPIRDELTRLSAPQGGPGGTYPCLPGKPNDKHCHADPGIGPGPMPLEMLNVATRPDGTNLAFFHSARRLVPQDTDDSYDVYQWRNSQLSLLTPDVNDPDGAFYLGNDRTGQNVYFATRDQLTWQDKDRALDVYTTRLGGGIPQPPLTPKCDAMADKCQVAGTNPPRPSVNSNKLGGTNFSPGRKRTIKLSRLSATQRKQAANHGVLAIRVHTNRAGLIKISAKAKIGRNTRTLAKGSKRLRKAGATTIRLHLNAAARRHLATGNPLRISITARAPGATPKTISTTLKQ